MVSLVVTLVIMAALGIRAFIDCPKQISELAQRLINANSDFANVLTKCYGESSGVKWQFRNATLNLIATINELKDLRMMVEEYKKLTLLLKETLALIKHVQVDKNCTNLWEEAVQDLLQVHGSYMLEARIKIHNVTLPTVANKCTNWLQQLEEEYLNMQKIINREFHQFIGENVHRDGRNYTTLRTKIQYMRGFVGSCLETLKEKNFKLQTVKTCCTEEVRRGHQMLQTINSSGEALLVEIDRLKKMKGAIQSFIVLHRENKEWRKIEQNKSAILNHCSQKRRAVQTMANSFPSVWDHCDKETFKCSPCRPNWSLYSSRCFYSSTEKTTWLLAYAQCVALGGNLVVMSGSSELKFLTQLARGHSTAWIGLMDLVVENRFMWVNGKDLGNWATISSNSLKNHCVALKTSVPITRNWTNSLEVFHCFEKRPYICETSALDDPTT